MYVTRYQWLFDPFYGWQLRPVQVFIPVYTTVIGYYWGGVYYYR